MLKDESIVLGVTGSIACYKAADLTSKLVQAGASVHVILTREASQFITPLTFQSLTHRPVVMELFEPTSELAMDHVALAQKARLVVVAPATANIIAKVANGLADDALTCTILATQAPLLIAPAMDAHMWENPATQENVARLQARGATIVGPEHGRMASGLVGTGRLADVDTLLGAIRWLLGHQGDLFGYRILVTAGGTQEPIDPVRIVTNRSSGKMGYALAEAARDRGAQVVLITTPTTSRATPYGVEVRCVQTALEMRDAVAEESRSTSALVMAAAVADYMPEQSLTEKLKKTASSFDLRLVRTPDILGEVEGEFIKVGFAAESGNLVANARQKLRKKNLDLIVANDITEAGSGFGSDTNRVVLLDRAGTEEPLPILPKYDVAQRILDRVASLLKSER